MRVSALCCALLAGAVSLPGCGGGEQSGGQVAPEDPAKVTARNNSMEEYMKSPEGKKAAKPPR